MKGLNKLVLVSAIAAISAGAQAELKALDDSAMGELTGQAGLTIDIETKWSIGEFAYRDGGSVLFQDIQMGGSDHPLYGGEMLDNIRLNLDVADGVESLHYGFSEITELANTLRDNFGNVDTTIEAIATNVTAPIGRTPLNGQIVPGDGDLVIHIDATDHLARAGGFDAVNAGVTPISLATVDLGTLIPIVHAAVDFGYSIGAIKLASSDYNIGSGAPTAGNHTSGETFTGAGQATTLISDLSINGFLGPVDIRIENNGDAHGTYDAAGVFTASATDAGDAASKILWDTYVDVTDLDVYIDIAGVKIENMQINNKRGNTNNIDGDQSFGFAHSKREIFAVKDAVLDMSTGLAQTGANVAYKTDGIAINTQFAGDMEIGALSFGDTETSIGELFFTDITSTTNWTISAH